MRVEFFYFFLFAVLGLSWWRGRSDERMAAATCVAGTLLTVIASAPLSQRFASFDFMTFLVDVGVLAAFVTIALRSTRFWPMWVAGLQLTGTSVHLLKLIDEQLMRFVFGAALAFWSYPILLLIAVGAWRTEMVERWRRQRGLPQPS